MEASDVLVPKPTRGAKKPRPRLHPFCADTGTLLRMLYLDGASKTITLRLHAVKGIPLPSPQLIHNWSFDFRKSKTFFFS